MESEIKKILSNLEVPVAHLKYTGKETTYVTWTILSEEPFFNADDEILYSLVTIDIDIYSKGNYLNILSSIKKIMKENEWTWDEDGEEMYENDTKLYHRTSTFIKERKI